jgi:hypothetical protein
MHIERTSAKRVLRAQTWLICAALIGCADAGSAPEESPAGSTSGSTESTAGAATLGNLDGIDDSAPVVSEDVGDVGGEATGEDPAANPETLGAISFLGGLFGGGGGTDAGSPGGGGGNDAGAGGGDPGEISSCLKGITNFFDEGPFRVTTRNSGSIKMWVPQVPAGCKVPMIHISNGTGATCSFYGAAIRRYASHGFLTLCYENANTGAGLYGIQAFEKALELYPNLADRKFGSSGHSQGGQAAFVTGQFAEEKWPDGVHAILAMQPASGFGNQPRERWQTVYGKIKQPAAMYSGNSTDGLVSKSWVQDAFKALNDSTEAYHWSKSGASHFSPSGDSMEMGVAWFRWKLLGDQDACRAFKTVPTKFRGWTVVAEQAKRECN